MTAARQGQDVGGAEHLQEIYRRRCFQFFVVASFSLTRFIGLFNSATHSLLTYSLKHKLLTTWCGQCPGEINYRYSPTAMCKFYWNHTSLLQCLLDLHTYFMNSHFYGNYSWFPVTDFSLNFHRNSTLIKIFNSIFFTIVVWNLFVNY